MNHIMDIYDLPYVCMLLEGVDWHGFFDLGESKSDVQLIKETADGNAAAFEELYKRYVNKVYSYLITRCKNQDDVKDILQETFISVWKSCSLYKGQSKLITWIIGIARNKLYDNLRKAYKQRSDDINEGIYSERNNMYDKLETRIVIKELLDKLPDADQELVFMVFNLEMKYAEISSILEVPEGTVKSRMSRIRRQLKSLLER